MKKRLQLEKIDIYR